MNSALKENALSVFPLCANTMGQGALSPWNFCQSGAGSESLCSGAALSPFSLPLFMDRALSTQNGLSTEVQDKQLQIDVAVALLCLENSCLLG